MVWIWGVSPKAHVQRLSQLVTLLRDDRKWGLRKEVTSLRVGLWSPAPSFLLPSIWEVNSLLLCTFLTKGSEAVESLNRRLKPLTSWEPYYLSFLQGGSIGHFVTVVERWPMQKESQSFFPERIVILPEHKSCFLSLWCSCYLFLTYFMSYVPWCISNIPSRRDREG